MRIYTYQTKIGSDIVSNIVLYFLHYYDLRILCAITFYTVMVENDPWISRAL
jgi:hypothetical protein